MGGGGGGGGRVVTWASNLASDSGKVFTCLCMYLASNSKLVRNHFIIRNASFVKNKNLKHASQLCHYIL